MSKFKFKKFFMRSNKENANDFMHKMNDYLVIIVELRSKKYLTL